MAINGITNGVAASLSSLQAREVKAQNRAPEADKSAKYSSSSSEAESFDAAELEIASENARAAAVNIENLNSLVDELRKNPRFMLAHDLKQADVERLLTN